MEAYKTICPECKHARYWVGYKTGLGKTPEQLAQMHKEETTCVECGSLNAKTELDRESETGQIFAASTTILVNTLADLMRGK